MSLDTLCTVFHPLSVLFQVLALEADGGEGQAEEARVVEEARLQQGRLGPHLVTESARASSYFLS